MPSRILGVGTVTIDNFLFVEQYPEPDQKQMILEERRSLGGLVGTALAAASSLGGRCSFWGAVGGDPDSREIIRGLRNFGIECNLPAVESTISMVHSYIIVDRSCQTRTILYSDPQALFPAGDHFDEANLDGMDALLVDQSGLSAARCAKRRGVPVIADMDWTGRSDQWEFMELADHLLLSSGFAGAVTKLEKPVDIVRSLHGTSDRVCTAVTSGCEGCFFLSRTEGHRVQHIPVFEVPVAETTGCGDVFHGAYAYAQTLDYSARDSLVFGSAAAALYASRPSGWRYLPKRTEVEDLIRRQPIDIGPVG
jgi:sulfofructose kinase